MSKNKFGIIAVLLGVIGFSFKGIFIKLIYLEGGDFLTVMGYRGFISLPFFICAYFIFRQKNKITKGGYLRIAICSVLFYLSSLTDTIGLGLIPVNIERVVMFTIPIFVLLLSFIFLKKTYKMGVYIAAIISWIGVAISFISKGIEGGSDIVGILFVIASTITYASYILISSIQMRHQNALEFNAIVMSLCCFISLVPVVVSSNFDVSVLIPPKDQFISPLSLAFLSTVLPSFFMMYGMKRCGEVVSTSFNNIGPFITMGAGALVLSEMFTAYDVVGAIIVSSGIFYINKSIKKQ